MKIRIIALGLLVCLSCRKEDKLEREIANIEINTEVDRFDQLFASSQPNDLPKLKKKYPYLFPIQYPDSLWIAQMQDSLYDALSVEAKKAFPDFTNEKNDLVSLFQHIQYYFPGKNVPKVITIISGVDYKNKAIYADSLAIISLDTYLGDDHEFYTGIQEFIRKDFTKKMIVSDLSEDFAKSVIPYLNERTFISQMLYQGKILYLKDKLIPEVSDSDKIGYTEAQLIWAGANESEIWRYFVEESLLFSTDSKLQERFIEPAPFSKFYLELDAESPGRVGAYIGWQIIKSYMRNNDVSLQELLRTPAEEIFNKAKFKPKK